MPAYRFGLYPLILAAALWAPLRAHANWVASWSASPATINGSSLRGTTIREYMRLSLGGAQLRVRFSNETGTSSLAILGAHLSLPGSAPGSVDPASDRVRAFGGAATATVSPGAVVLSDPVDFPVAPLSKVAVTGLYDSTSSAQVGHLLGLDTSYLESGDHLGDPALAGAAPSMSRYYVSAIDVSTTGQVSSAIGTLGDSITDGMGSTMNRDTRWTDRLAERYVTRTGGPALAVVDGGLTGNAVLSGTLLGSVGPGALARLDRDVLARPGIRWLVLFEGINDIGSAQTGTSVLSSLITAYQQVIARAHDRGIKVVGATLTPFAGSGAGYFTPAKEVLREKVNQWIRNGGAYDAVLDFDVVLRDPSNPTSLLPAYDSGDHLHPNDAGYRALGDSVPLDLFR